MRAGLLLTCFVLGGCSDAEPAEVAPSTHSLEPLVEVDVGPLRRIETRHRAGPSELEGAGRVLGEDD